MPRLFSEMERCDFFVRDLPSGRLVVFSDIGIRGLLVVATACLFSCSLLLPVVGFLLYRLSFTLAAEG